MVLTQGEKMVWAAVYGVEYMRRVNMQPLDGPAGEGSREWWEAWEREQAHSAIESAACAVELMRSSEPEIEDGFGSDHEVTQMLRAMLGDEG